MVAPALAVTTTATAEQAIPEITALLLRVTLLRISLLVGGNALVVGGRRRPGRGAVLCFRVDETLKLATIEKDAPALGALVNGDPAALVGVHLALALRTDQHSHVASLTSVSTEDSRDPKLRQLFGGAEANSGRRTTGLPSLSHTVCYIHVHMNTQTDVDSMTNSLETDDDGSCASAAADMRLVGATRHRMPSGASSRELADLFRMLGDTNRIRILSALLVSEELCVCDLAGVLESSESSVSHALRLLRTSGMVRSRRQGKRVFYALDDAHVRVLLELSTEHLAHLRAPYSTPANTADTMGRNS